MVRVGGFLKSQNRIRRQRARGRFISPYQVGGTIFGKSTTARYPLMHTSSRLVDPLIRKHLTRRRTAPRRTMKGGIFGKLLGPGDLRKVLWANQAKARKQRQMKGGTIFGTSTRMRQGDPMQVLQADQEKAMMKRWLGRRMKGGNLFSQLKKRIQIDFPHRPFPAAHPMSDVYRLRKGIKRIRRGRR